MARARHPEHNGAAEGAELPEGWVPTTLGEVCELNPSKPPRDFFTADAPVTFVPMAAVDADSGTIAAPEVRPFATVRKGFTSFRDGDVIMAKITPCAENGKAAVANSLQNGIGFGSTEFHVLRPSQAVLAEYVYRFIRQEAFRDAATAEMTGSVGQKRVPAWFLEQAFMPLPPLAEQKRIVAKIDALLARVDPARERLAKVPAILKRFRQSVLAAACSGRLTEDWREVNPVAGSVDDLVRELRVRRESEAGSPIARQDVRQIYESPEENDGSGLPESWRFVALNKLCASFDYGTSAKSQPSGIVPVLRMGNLQNGEIDWQDLVFTSNAEEIQRYSLAPNTVLFNRTNSPELVGKTAIYRGERPAIFAGYLIRIVNFPQLSAEYLNLCLNSGYARDFCSREKTDGVSQSNINARKLGTFEVPLCPLTEQREIVRRVEGLFKLADAIEKRVATATARAEKLTQSILAKAFRGELVPTEAEFARRAGREYEPAFALLARTQAGAARDTGARLERRRRAPATLRT